MPTHSFPRPKSLRKAICRDFDAIPVEHLSRRASMQPPLPPRGDETPVLVGDVRAERRAGVAEAPHDPCAVVAAGDPRVRVLELERDRLETVAVELDEEEQAEVVAQVRLDTV